MTKVELLADLEVIFLSVLSPKLKWEDGDWRCYAVKVIDKTAQDTTTDVVVGFRVYKEGTGEESAYWNGHKPSSQSTILFREEVQAKLDTAIQNDLLNIKAGWIEKVDSENEKVEVRVMRGVAPDIIEQYAIVYRDGANLNFYWFKK